MLDDEIVKTSFDANLHQAVQQLIADNLDLMPQTDDANLSELR